MSASNLQAVSTASIRSNVALKHRESDYTARLALDENTRRDAFALRYKSYLASGFIEQNSTKLFSDKFDDLPNSATIVIYSEGKAIASVRTCFLSRDGTTTSPARETFPDEVNRLLAEAGSSRSNLEGVEFTRLVRSPEAANNQGLVFLLYRLAGYLSLRNDFRVMLSCVRQNHVPFYKRLRFREVTAARAYPGLNCPMQLLACSRADLDEVRAGFPILDPDAASPESFDGFLQGQLVPLSIVQPT